MLGYADPEASQLTWDQATKKLAAGGCAFESMNDSAFGELVAAGAQEGEDFGSTAVPRHRRKLPRRRRRLRRRDQGEERQERARVPRRHQRARHAARVPQGEGVGPGPPRRRRLVADRLPASVLEGLVGVAGAAVDRPRRGDEPGVPGGLLRRGVRPTSGRGARTRSPTTSRTRSPRTSSRRAKPDRRCRAYQAKCVTGRAKRLPSELVVGQIAIDGSSERRRVSGSGARSGRAVEASRADAAHSHNVGEIRGPHTTELAQRRSRIRVNWALAAGTWQRVTPRSRAVRGPPQAGMRHQWRPMSRLWLRRPLPASCAIGWACPACDRALIDAQVRHHRRRQAGEHFRLRQPGLQVMDDGAQEP